MPNKNRYDFHSLIMWKLAFVLQLVLIAVEMFADEDSCVLLFAGVIRDRAAEDWKLEWYHPDVGVECDRDAIGQLKAKSVRGADWDVVATSGCYLASTHQVVLREGRERIPPMLYDLRSGEATELPMTDTPAARSTSAAVGSSKCMSCSGINKDWTVQSSCYEFDASASGQKQWRRMKDMPRGVTQAASATLNNQYYFISGGHRGKAQNSTYRYDMSAQSWRQESAKMPGAAVGRWTHAAIALSTHEMMLCGGRDARADCHAYNVVFRAWRPLGKLRHARRGLQLINFNGDIYSLGGQRRDGKVVDNVEKFDRQTETWQPAKPLKRGRTDFVAVVVGHDPTMFGATLPPF